MLKGGADTVQGHRKQFCIRSGKCIEARIAPIRPREARKKIFTFIIQSSGLALVPPFCALHALLTGRPSLSDVVELAILWALLTDTVML